jgi:hypothetical protein
VRIDAIRAALTIRLKVALALGKDRVTNVKEGLLCTSTGEKSNNYKKCNICSRRLDLMRGDEARC